MKKLVLAITIVFVPALWLAASPSCQDQTAPTQKMAPKNPPIETASTKYDPVALVWQKKFLEMMQEADEGYALFTAGGWSNQGQYLVLLTDGKATYKRVAPGSKTISKEQQLADAKLKTFLGTVTKVGGLKNTNVNAMDNLVFEFVHAKGKNPQVVNRVYINNPEIEKMPRHSELIEAFRALER